MTLEAFNALPAVSAEAELVRCCASRRWAHLVAAERPFLGDAAMEVLEAAAERVWWSLNAADWLEAFAAHPRIGERTESTWPVHEQAAAAGASEDVRERLAMGNRLYESRFGYTFLVCATGKTAREILTMLERRLQNAPDAELQVAAREQRRITDLRLARLFTT
jgi:2-oxo-4-hydroxy-4-carboxy-5-ureidoimidazoline decarboxylase